MFFTHKIQQPYSCTQERVLQVVLGFMGMMPLSTMICIWVKLNVLKHGLATFFNKIVDATPAEHPRCKAFEVKSQVGTVQWLTPVCSWPFLAFESLFINKFACCLFDNRFVLETFLNEYII